LQNVVAKARGFESTPAGFAPLKVEPIQTQEKVQHEEELNLLDLEPLPNDHPLVRAAKEQALAALEVSQKRGGWVGFDLVAPQLTRRS